MRYNLLFRWFFGLALEDPIWDHSTFSKNRDRLLAHQVAEGLFAEVLRLAVGCCPRRPRRTAKSPVDLVCSIADDSLRVIVQTKFNSLLDPENNR